MVRVSQRWVTVDLGSGVVAEARPLKFGDYLRLLGMFSQLNVGVAALDEQGRAQVGHRLLSDEVGMRLIAEIVPRYLRNVSGIEVELEDGSVTVGTAAELVEHAALFQQLFVALVKLMELSTLNAGDKKNLTGSPAAISAEATASSPAS